MKCSDRKYAYGGRVHPVWGSWCGGFTEDPTGVVAMPKGEESGADDEEDRELKLLSAAIAMAEASTGDEDTTENEEPPHPSTPPIPSDAKEGEQQKADAAILNPIEIAAVEIAATMLSDGGGGGVAMTPKLSTGSMRR